MALWFIESTALQSVITHDPGAEQVQILLDHPSVTKHIWVCSFSDLAIVAGLMRLGAPDDLVQGVPETVRRFEVKHKVLGWRWPIGPDQLSYATAIALSAGLNATAALHAASFRERIKFDSGVLTAVFVCFNPTFKNEALSIGEVLDPRSYSPDEFRLKIDTLEI